MEIKKTLKNSVLITIMFIVICGLIYPAVMTGISQVLFNKQANGSIVKYNGREVGSELLGQNFSDERFFHGRVSAISYNTYKKGDKKYTRVSSGSQNLAPSNKVLIDRVKKDMKEFIKTHKGVNEKDVPTDLLTSSASGLDSDISPKAAEIQIPLVAEKTGLSVKVLKEIVKNNTKDKTLGVFGEKRVNVLSCNLEIAKKIGIK